MLLEDSDRNIWTLTPLPPQKKMAFQLLALANGDRVKDKQRSRNSFVVDMDKKVAAENLLKELHSYHGAAIRQV